MDPMSHSAKEVDLWNELTTPIPICGCGKSSDTMCYIISILKAIQHRSESDWSQESSLALHRAFRLPLNRDGHVNHSAGWFLMYTLDHLELTEHGGNVMGCWLTEKGHRAIELYTAIESAIPEDCFDEPEKE